MLDHLHFLNYPKPLITKEHFSRWKQDPVTIAMKKFLVSEVLSERDSPLPLTVDGTVVVAHQREGMESVVATVLNWAPELVEESDAN